jgi:hypothetical protein
LLVDPFDSRRVYSALAREGETEPSSNSALGIFASADGGITWSRLQDSPRDYITTRLAIDLSMPQYLFGATGVGTWRYALTELREPAR